MRRVRKGSDGSGDLERMGRTNDAQEIGGGVPCPAGCECECLSSASSGVVESWEVMMGAIEVMRAREAKEAARALKKSSRDNSRQGSRSNSHARIVVPSATTQLFGGKIGDGKHVDARRRMTEEWDDATGEWDTARSSMDNPAAARPQGKKEVSATSSTGLGIGRRLGQVRASDGLGWVRKKSSSLRNGESG